MPLVFGHREVSKYRAQRIVVSGLVFASQGEAIRWGELVYLEKAGELAELRRQVAFDLHAGDRSNLLKIGCYVADFTYYENTRSPELPRWRWIVEDFKGFPTPLYRWKKKHLELEYDLTVRETADGRRR